MKKIHYAWFICAVCTLMLFTCMGVVANGFAVFMPMIRDEYGLTNAQTSSLITLRNLVTFCGTWMTTIFYDKVGLRVGTTTAGILAGISFMIYSFADNYPLFCIGAAISGFAYAFGTMVPAAILMNRWFVKNKALALGIVGAGSGVAMIVIPPIATILAESAGLPFAFRAQAIFMFCVAVVIFLVIKESPESLGLRKFGESEEVQVVETAAKTNAALPDASGPALPKSIYATLIAACMLTGAVASVGYAHLSVLYTDAGFDSMFIASLISIIGLLLTVAKVFFGHITDRWGGFGTSMAFWLLVIIGHVGLCMAYTGNAVIAYGVAVVLGIGYSLTNLGASYWANDMVKQEHYPKVIRTLNVSQSAGALICSSVPGILADMSGNYLSSYIMFTAFTCAATILTFLAYRQYRVLNS
ncbi:MAG: MFS transporter [Clostridiales bacterium]|nr:MFS transporter [Clostridiales bacterium]